MADEPVGPDSSDAEIEAWVKDHPEAAIYKMTAYSVDEDRAVVVFDWGADHTGQLTDTLSALVNGFEMLRDKFLQVHAYMHTIGACPRCGPGGRRDN
jgi:hypothetical protein